MFKIIIIFLVFLNFNNALAKESLLTLKQQLDRLQREVSDISKIVNKTSSENENTDLIISNPSGNLSALDLRIYDLEKDIKKLNENLEEIIFQIDDFKILYDRLEANNLKISSADNNLSIDKSVKIINSDISKEAKKENSLGNLTISSVDLSEQNNLDKTKSNEDIEDQESFSNLSSEEQFQVAFDLLRNQKFKEAIIAFKNFIKDNESNKLSGSAHYWLGELYLLKKDYREAALILAEGFQKHKNSTKAPDTLYKLSLSLIGINKNKDACNTLEKLINDFPTSDIADKGKDKLISENCNFNSE